MSNLKDTYGKQWSDDPALLKKLLNAGEEIIISHGESHLRKMRAENGTIDLNQGTRFGKQPILVDEAIDFFAKVGCKFLLPAPSVEPAPLEWETQEEVESDIPELDYLEPRYDNPANWLVATDGVFTYNIHIDGFWEIVGMHCHGYLDTRLHDELAPHENFDTAKAQIHEWRVNHLNSMIKK